MRIEVSRSGGLMGVTRRVVLDVHAHADAEAWQALTRSDGVERTDAVPDGYSWRIRIDSRTAVLTDREFGGRLREQAEQALREAFRRPR